MSDTIERSYRSVPMCPADAMAGAALYLEREWGSSRSLGYAGTWNDSFDRTWYIFQCRASDGSRWLIRADRYGNYGVFDRERELEIANLLDVEVS